jgi:hypothetical protein
MFNKPLFVYLVLLKIPMTITVKFGVFDNRRKAVIISLRIVELVGAHCLKQVFSQNLHLSVAPPLPKKF